MRTRSSRWGLRGGGGADTLDVMCAVVRVGILSPHVLTTS